MLCRCGDGAEVSVNPEPVFGHRPGQEFWRLRDDARAQGWARQQFIDEFNKPDHFQIEDAPGNSSHKCEVPERTHRGETVPP